jgi:hypothetical protein
MYYAPQRSPEKPGMPVLGYFVAVGAALTALLFAADAYVERPAKLSFASNFYGLPAEFRGEPGTRRPAVPEPQVASFSLAAETTGSAASAEPPHVAAAPEVVKPAKQPPRKVVVHKQRQPRQEEEDWFGNNNRRDFASSRDPFSSNYRERDSFSNSREREPSWRDSWASGAFDQQRERGSRRASRQNNDFWFR